MVMVLLLMEKLPVLRNRLLQLMMYSRVWWSGFVLRFLLLFSFHFVFFLVYVGLALVFEMVILEKCLMSIIEFTILNFDMQLKQPSHPTRGAPIAISCLSSLLKEPVVRSSFVQADGVKLLVPLISPASTQQSIQVTIYLVEVVFSEKCSQKL